MSEPALPRITVVTPSFNQGRFLEQTIRSVLDQEYPNLELMVLDGGSTDESVSIIKRYEPRLAYWRSSRDAGQGAAILEGFRRASGELVTWLNSDDLLLRGALRAVGESYRADVAYYYGDLLFIDEGGAVVSAFLAPPPWVSLFKNGLLTHGQPGTFYARSFVETVGFFRPELQYSMEYDLELALLQAGARMARIEAPLAALRVYATTKTIAAAAPFARERRAVFRERIPGPFGNLYVRAATGRLLRAALAARYLSPRGLSYVGLKLGRARNVSSWLAP